MKKAGTDLSGTTARPSTTGCRPSPTGRTTSCCATSTSSGSTTSTASSTPRWTGSSSTTCRRGRGARVPAADEQQPIFGNDLVAVTREAAAKVAASSRSWTSAGSTATTRSASSCSASWRCSARTSACCRATTSPALDDSNTRHRGLRPALRPVPRDERARRHRGGGSRARRTSTAACSPRSAVRPDRRGARRALRGACDELVRGPAGDLRHAVRELDGKPTSATPTARTSPARPTS